jgi:uncharacterized protein (UPF0548 family)
MSGGIEVRDAIRCGRRRDGVVDDVAMPVRVLDEQQAAELRATSLSYLRRPDQADQAPAGFARLRCTRTLSRRDFDEAAADLLSWRMHERAGLHVLASDIPLRIDTVVLMRWGPGPLSLRIPCRVVELVDEPRRRGFSYGTLTGHPETGEERFLLEQLDDGRVTLTITAISRPASTLARLGGPLTRAAQRWMTQRYLGALDLQ